MEPSTINFPANELRCSCSHCNKRAANKCDPKALAALQLIRDELGEPMALNSAYRCPKHPEEARKARAGQHSLGNAFDIQVGWGAKRMRIVDLAIKHGFNGFGFANSFIHIDFRPESARTCWTYN